MIKYHCTHVGYLILLFSGIILAMAQNTNVSVNVGVLLDFDSLYGKIGLSCINMALSDFYVSHAHYKTRLVLHTRDSLGDVVVEAAEVIKDITLIDTYTSLLKTALDLIKNAEVQAIILGPEPSMQHDFVMNLGDKSQVPIISFSTTSPSRSSYPSSYFFRVAQSDSAQVEAISDIIHNYGWSEAVPIYVDNEFGDGVVPYLANALQVVDARIPYWCVIPLMATDDQIVEKLQQLMTMRTRVFIIHMLPSLGSRLFAKAKEIGMMGDGYVWIMTDRMTNFFGSMNSSVTHNMQDVLGLKTYIPNTKELDNFRQRWQIKFQLDNPTILNVQLDVFGLWAYDAVWALAMAVEKVGTANFLFNKMNISHSSIEILERLGVSESGPELVQALSIISYEGLSGNFSLLYGELQASNFQIVNVNGNTERGIGYWTTKTGLVRNMSFTSRRRYSSTDSSILGPIIWPGETTTSPKGWEIPLHGNRMRILVPVNSGFEALVVPVKSGPNTLFTGYCIDVFTSVIERLPYSVTYEFIPFDQAGSYDDLIYQVFLGYFDAAVGDISRRANRSLYVDFSLPYTDTGVSMILPINDNQTSKNWVFLKPFTSKLWLTIMCFFVFIGFVVWVLEHRINKDFRGPPHQQIGTSLWFSFSTLVFAHGDQVMSNLTRFVVIVWCFVILILTQSYTAILSSVLTVKQLQPTDVDVLLKNGGIVGYQRGSFVYGILLQVGFSQDKLRSYNSTETLHELFQRGSISAAFDETPYVKVFLSTYCSEYTMVVPTLFEVDSGFGFVFQKGSPLTLDVSAVISDQGEQRTIRSIEDKWLGKLATCMSPKTTGSSNSPFTLSTDSFSGLFLIAWLSSSVALLIFAAMFFHQNWHVLVRSDPDLSFWRRICILLQIYNREDISLHNTRQSGPQETATSEDAVESSPSSPRSSRHSSHTANDVVLEMQDTSSTRQSDLNLINGQISREIE